MEKEEIASKESIPVVYQDEQFIVFNKPSGLLVIPTEKNEKRTLVSIVNEQFAAQRQHWQLHPCHRIDRETSGLIMFAKGKAVQQKMMDAFKMRSVYKKYIAFVHGRLKYKQGELKDPVLSLDRKKRSPHKHVAQSAITRYKVILEKPHYTVVEVEPITGRTNQIRIHFSEQKHALIGERKYAFPRDYSLQFKRVALHAKELSWINPVTKKKIFVEIDIPKDMQDFLYNHK